MNSKKGPHALFKKRSPVPLFEIKQCWARFLPRFSGIFSEIQGFCQNFWQIKTFRCALAPPAPPLPPEPLFTSDGRWNKEIDTQVCETNAALREFHRSVVTNRQLSNTAKLSDFCSIPHL